MLWSKNKSLVLIVKEQVLKILTILLLAGNVVDKEGSKEELTWEEVITIFLHKLVPDVKEKVRLLAESVTFVNRKRSFQASKNLL